MYGHCTPIESFFPEELSQERYTKNPRAISAIDAGAKSIRKIKFIENPLVS